MLVFFDIKTRPSVPSVRVQKILQVDYFFELIDCLVHAISAFSEHKVIAHCLMMVQTGLEKDSYL